MLTCPQWIALKDDERQHLDFIWDDTRAVQDLAGDAGEVLSASMQLSLRARLVLCAGLYEWIVWRFDGLHTRVEPIEIAEVAWCATVDPRYMRFFELPRSQWRGPVEGPLWCAAMWLQPAMSKGHLFPKQVYEALSLLTRMGLHVLPDVGRFRAWLRLVLARMRERHPLLPDDPFDDLFERRTSVRLGPLIGREALDPTALPDTPGEMVFLSGVLRDARMSANPFLATPGDLRDVGFTGEPYVLKEA